MKFSVDVLSELVSECKRRYESDCITDDDFESKEYYSGLLQGLFGCVMVLSDDWPYDSCVLSGLIDEIFPF